MNSPWPLPLNDSIDMSQLQGCYICLFSSGNQLKNFYMAKKFRNAKQNRRNRSIFCALGLAYGKAFKDAKTKHRGLRLGAWR